VCEDELYGQQQEERHHDVFDGLNY
jgi:hypothetical protein